MGKFVAVSHQYLSIPASSSFDFGSTDLTIDFWAKFNSLPASGSLMVLCGQLQDGRNYYELQIYNNSGTYQLQFNVDAAGSWSQAISENVSVSTGTKYHVEMDRSGYAWYLFLNGSLLGATTNSLLFGLMPSLSVPFTVGSSSLAGGGNLGEYFDGWLKEFRVSNGIARHNGSFTPPTAEYAPDFYTVLLLHMDTNFNDSSWRNNVVTPVNGPVIVPTQSPFSASTYLIQGGGVTYSGVTDATIINNQSGVTTGYENIGQEP
jgi:hypothetical protein